MKAGEERGLEEGGSSLDMGLCNASLLFKRKKNEDIYMLLTFLLSFFWPWMTMIFFFAARLKLWFQSQRV